MFYEVTSKIVRMDSNGNDKEVLERLLIKDCELFAEAETRAMQEYNNENNVVAIKQSKILEFVNERTDDDESIYLATIESVFTDDYGNETTSKYVVGLFSDSVEKATKTTIDYMKQGMDDLILVGIKRTKFIDLI